MSDVKTHQDVVAAWLAAAPGETVEAVLDRLQLGAEIINAAAGYTLSRLTLRAVFERVLAYSRSRFPELADLEPDAEGIDTKKVRAQGQLPSVARTRACAQYVLAELLTVIGNLTAEILTPRLHAALERGRRPRRGAAPSKEGKKK